MQKSVKRTQIRSSHNTKELINLVITKIVNLEIAKSVWTEEIVEIVETVAIVEIEETVVTVEIEETVVIAVAGEEADLEEDLEVDSKKVIVPPSKKKVMHMEVTTALKKLKKGREVQPLLTEVENLMGNKNNEDQNSKTRHFKINATSFFLLT